MSIALPRPPRPAARRRDRLARTVALLVAPLLLAHPLHAQEPAPAPDSASAAARTVTLAGVVRDTAGHPLSGAEVRAGATQFTLTGADGGFLLTGVAPDTIQLLVRRIGYLPADVVLEAQAGLRVELAVKLVPAVTELGTITIEGKQMDTRLWKTGFYDREKLGRGTLFGPDKLEHYGGTLSTIMREVPSVRVQIGRYGSGIAYGPAMAGGLCPLNVFLDGMLIRWANDVGLDQLVNRQDVLAIEVYPRATQMPSYLSGYTGGADGASAGGFSTQGPVDCGALVIWTKPFDGKKAEQER
jgi:hypothetical protein